MRNDDRPAVVQVSCHSLVRPGQQLISVVRSLNGVAHLQLVTCQHAVTDLPPAETVRLDQARDATGLESDAYRVPGYVLYDAKVPTLCTPT